MLKGQALLDAWCEAKARDVTQKEHAKILGMKFSTYKSRLYRAQRDADVDIESPCSKKASHPRAFLEYMQDGTVRVSKLLKMTMEDSLDPERVMEIAGFEPERWQIKHLKFNDWNGQRPKDRGQLINHQVTLTVEPKKPVDLTLSDIKKFYDEMRANSTPKKKAKRKAAKNCTSKSTYALEVDLADMHNGRMTVAENAMSTKKKMDLIADKVLGMARGMKFSAVYLAVLGDFVDIDTMKATTTKGTPQYITTTPYSILRSSTEMLVEMIYRLKSIAPVKYVHVPGNHDRLLSYAVANAIYERFYSDKNVEVDLGEETHKWDVFGLCLMAWTHGDISKKNMFGWLPVRARSEWGVTKFAEIHSGHINDQKVFEHSGQVVRYLPSPNDPSLWEEERGYGGLVRASTAFVWNSMEGVQNQWFINV